MFKPGHRNAYMKVEEKLFEAVGGTMATPRLLIPFDKKERLLNGLFSTR